MKRLSPAALLLIVIAALFPADAFPAIKINEIKVKGTEFIELYNTSASSQNVTNWTLSNQLGQFITLTSSVPGLGYRTWTNGEAAPDNLPLSFLDNNGDVLTLRDASGVVIDDVGFGARGGAPLGFNSTGRFPNGDDTNDWARDWEYLDDALVVSPESPDSTNQQGAPALGSSLILNELDYQGTGAGAFDRIEIYNPTGSAINLQGYWVSDSDGFCRINNSIVLAAGGRVLLSEDAVGQGMDCAGNDDIEYGTLDMVYLFTPAGVRIDQLGFEGAPALAANESLQRCPDGGGPHDAYSWTTQGALTTYRKTAASFGATNNNCLSPAPSLLDLSRTPCVPLTSQSVQVQVVALNAITGSVLYRVNGGSQITQALSLQSQNGDTSIWIGSIPGQAGQPRVEYNVRLINGDPDTTLSGTRGYFVGTTSIATLRVNDGQGRNLYPGYGARVQGNVTVPPGVYSSANVDFYVQDATGGINLFQLGSHADLNALSLGYGDLVTAAGELGQFNGKLELGRGECDTLVFIRNGSGTVPAVQTVLTCNLGESFEGKLVRFDDAVFQSQASGDTLFVNTNYPLSNCAPGKDMRIEDNTGIPGTMLPGTCDTVRADVVGVCVQFDATLPHADGYQITPRNPGDLAFEDTGLSRQDVIDLVTAEVIEGSPYESTLVAFLYNQDQPDSLLHAGDVISDVDSTVFRVISDDTYFVFMDLETRAFWGHPAAYVFIDACTGAMEVDSALTWPRLNGVTIPRFMQLGNASPDIFFGLYGEWEAIPEFPVVPRQTDKVWGIIAAGEPINECDHAYIKNEIKRAKQHLNGLANGPGVNHDDIIVLGLDQEGDLIGASPDEICAAILSRMDCKKLFFTYVGHGLKAPGRMATRGESLTYEKLACKLLESKAEEVCIRIVACYSGSAVTYIVNAKKKIDGKVRTLKGTLTYTSSGVKTTRLDDRGARASDAFLTCLQDPDGDLNEDRKRTDIEGIQWAVAANDSVQYDEAGGVIFGDGKQLVTDPPRTIPRDKNSKDGAGTLEYERVKFTMTDPKTKKKKCYQRLYVINNKSDSHPPAVPGGPGVPGFPPPPAADQKTLIICCIDPRPATEVFRGKLELDKKERRCIGRVPGDCRKLDYKTANNALLSLASPDASHLNNTDARAAMYARGENLFMELPVEGLPGDDFTLSVEPHPGWSLTMDPPDLTIPALMPEQFGVLRGTVPDTSTQGADIFVTMAKVSTADTTVFHIQALLYDSLAVPVEAGDQFRHRYLESASGLLVSADSALLAHSVLRFVAPSSCLVDSGGRLVLDHTNIEADSAVSFSFTARGALDLRYSALIGPAAGLRLEAPQATIFDGAVIDSEGDGLVLIGDKSGTDLQFFLVANAGGDGVHLSGATGALLQAVSVEESQGDDVVAVNGTQVELRNSLYDAGKEVVEAGSTLTRTWTTAFQFMTGNGYPIYGVTVEVKDSFGATVALDTSSAAGLSGFHALTQYVNTGTAVTFHTPHQLLVHSAFGDTTLTYVADDLRVTEYVLVDSSVTGIGMPVELALVQNAPNPVRTQTVIGYELPHRGPVCLRVFDVRGALVTTLVEETMGPGRYEAVWRPGEIAPGLYFYRLEAMGAHATRKMLVIPP